MKYDSERLLVKTVFDMTKSAISLKESGCVSWDDETELLDNIHTWSDAFTVLYNSEKDEYDNIIKDYAEKLLIRTYGTKKGISKTEEVAGEILAGIRSFDFDPQIPACQDYSWQCYLINNAIEFDALLVALFNNKQNTEYTITEYPKWVVCYSDANGNGGIAGSISDFTKEIMCMVKEIGETACNIIRKVV